MTTAELSKVYLRVINAVCFALMIEEFLAGQNRHEIALVIAGFLLMMASSMQAECYFEHERIFETVPGRSEYAIDFFT